MTTTAQTLQAPALLADSIAEVLSAIARRSPAAAYWYGRDAARNARILDEATAPAPLPECDAAWDLALRCDAARSRRGGR